MLYIFLHSLAIYITSLITGVGVQGFSFKSIIISVAVAIVLAVANLTVKPLITIVTLPIHLITFGLSSLIVNGLMIKIASMIVNMIGLEFIFPSFAMAVWFAVVLSILNWVVDKFRN